MFTARSSGMVSSAPDAALASAPVSSGALRSWVITAAAPNAAARAQDGADVARIGHLVEHDERAGALQHVLQAGRRQRIGQQRHALVDDVAAEQVVEPAALHAFRRQRPGLAAGAGRASPRPPRSAAGGAAGGAGLASAAATACMAIQPDRAARRVRVVPRCIVVLWAWSAMQVRAAAFTVQARLEALALRPRTALVAVARRLPMAALAGAALALSRLALAALALPDLA